MRRPPIQPLAPLHRPRISFLSLLNNLPNSPRLGWPLFATPPPRSYRDSEIGMSQVFVQNFADTVTPTDAVVKTYTKNLADSVTPTDAVVKTYTMKPADTVTPTDAVVKTYTKNLTGDTVTPTDAVVKTYIMQPADTVTPSDGFNRVVTYIRSFADTVTPTDFAVISGTGVVPPEAYARPQVPLSPEIPFLGLPRYGDG